MKIQSFENFNEKKSDKKTQWIKDVIKKPGALKKSLGKEDETLTKGDVDAEIKKLVAKDKDKEKAGVQLDKKDAKQLRRLRLAKTLMSLKKEGMENYMFVGNLKTIKRLVDEMLEMDEQELDEILKEHDWASDHVSVATENIEQVFDFLLGYEPHDHEEGQHEEEEHELEDELGHEEEHEEEEQEIKNFDSFGK